MVLSQLEKTISINPFCDKVEVDSRPENTESVTVEISKKVNFMFEKYKEACLYILTHEPEPCVISFPPIDFNASEYISRIKLDILLPFEIELLLQSMKTIIEPGYRRIAGFMISQLINESYNAGNNHFKLTTNDCSIAFLFNNVKGTEKNPIIATVFGNAGDSFGYDSEHCIFDVKGNAGYNFGHGSKNCNYTIRGNVGDFCGDYSRDSIYNIVGNAGKHLGSLSQRSIYNVFGDAGHSIGNGSNKSLFHIFGKSVDSFCKSIENSIIKVYDQGMYTLLCEKMCSSNTVQLFDRAGKLMLETKK